MGFWDLFKSKDAVSSSSAEIYQTSEITQDDVKIIDRNLFVKDEKAANTSGIQSETSWKRIFDRIRRNYELEGYNDALSTADNKYRDDNTQILKLDLHADIQEAEIDVKEYLREVNFHISSRTKAELFDLVEELEAKKEICLERLKTMEEIKQDIINETGTAFRMILAYKRGFDKGLAALSMANIINRNI